MAFSFATFSFTRGFFILFAFLSVSLPALAAQPVVQTNPQKKETGAEARTSLYEFRDAFVRAAPGTITAGYVTIVNPTKNTDTLVGASADWAGRVEMHNVIHDKNGVMQMTAVHELTLPADGKLKLQPGGLHLMIFDVKKNLHVGQNATVELSFRNAGTVHVKFKVKPLTYKGGAATNSKPAAHMHQH